MSVGSVLKKVANAGLGAGKAILGPDGIGAFTEEAQAAPQMAPSAAAPPAESPFSLPEIDPNDPDFEEKSAIHDAYMEMYKRLAPDDGVNYQEKYGELAKHVSSRPSPRKWSPFSSFAIAMGGSSDGMDKVSSDNEKADKLAQDREDYILKTKEDALKGELAQLAQKGNFKKMLTQTALLEELAATQKRISDTRSGKQKLAEIEATNRGRANVAGIRASSARDVAATRANSLADKYKLNYEARKAMLSLASRMISGYQQQKDAAGEPIYSAEDMDRMADVLVDYAEEHSPIFTEGDAKPPTPAPAGVNAPPKPADGPKANDAVAKAFADRRAARAKAQKKN